MARSWRRLALPLALSLLGHGLLAGLAVVLRGGGDRPPAARARPDRPFSIRMGRLAGPTRPAPVPDPPEGPWIEVAFNPQVVPGPTPSPLPSEGSLGPTLRPEPGGHAGGAGDTHPAPSGGAGSPGAARAGALPAGVRRVVYLLDRSVSMGLYDALDTARAELSASLRALPPETLFQVLPFNHRVTDPLLPSPSGLVPADRDNVARALHRLDALPAAGGTEPVEALRAGLRLGPDLLVLLTDADDLGEAAVRAATHANGGRAAIDVVELTRDPRPRADGGLALLARLNRGRHRRLVVGR